MRTLTIQAMTVLICGVVELMTDHDDEMGLLFVGGTLGLLALLLSRWGREPEQVHRSTVLPGLAAMWVLTALIATAVFSLDGSVGLLEAATEAGAGLSTLAVTSVDPDQLGHGLLLYRSLLQWLGGLLILNSVLVVIPTFARSRGEREEMGPSRVLKLLGSRSARRSESITALYLALTATIAVGYVLVGMPSWGAMNNALTTASTGGFTVTSEGFAGYGPAEQWVAVLGMTLAGVGVMWIAIGLRGGGAHLMRSTGVRFYFIATLAVAALIVADGGVQDGVLTATREALFAATSASSTTGFRTASWSGLGLLSQMLLILLFGVGAAVGSAGGGFGARRLLAMVKMALRQLRTALHHHAVQVVRLDHRPISEAVLDRMGAYAALYVLVLGVGAFVFGLAGADMLGSISGAISAFSTMGPAFGDLTSTDHPQVIRVVQVGLAAIGRFGLFAITVMLAHGASVMVDATSFRGRR